MTATQSKKYADKTTFASARLDTFLLQDLVANANLRTSAATAVMTVTNMRNVLISKGASSASVSKDMLVMDACVIQLMFVTETKTTAMIMLFVRALDLAFSAAPALKDGKAKAQLLHLVPILTNALTTLIPVEHTLGVSTAKEALIVFVMKVSKLME
jgi:hypothetical protein